nr:glycoside hydrolase family 15 protein [Candidatus Protochlamydia phocaeensis]
MKDYQPIENYGVIGDLSTAALVGLNGSIDFLCYPAFDSPSIFAALLDKEKGGFFEIFPKNRKMKNKQMYLPDTNVLLTRFLSDEGIGEILDFMPVFEGCKDNLLIRRVKSIKGEMTYVMRCQPRFNYGRTSHDIFKTDHSLIFVSETKEFKLRLTSTVPLSIRQGDGYAEFTLKAGEEADFLLENLQDNDKPSSDLKPLIDRHLFLTIQFWRDWISQSNYNGRWREMVDRSALVLKLLTSYHYGSMVAAVTFGLPEKVGGSKNWDYRYTWIRDAAFTVYALIRLGYGKEARDFMNWVERLCKTIGKGGHLHLMYSIRGDEENLKEEILDNFEGYKGSKPVRIGNLAFKQVQLDIYGELMDSVYLFNKYVEPISYSFWNALSLQIDWLSQNWQTKDYSIWESRGKPKEYLYSRLMCWVAFDRAVRIAEGRSFPINSKWIKERDAIYCSIYQDFWNEELQAFVQYKGGKALDASTLLMPLMRFISPKDPKWLSTLKLIEEKLGCDSLIYRYRRSNRKSATPVKNELHSSEEGTFSLCSFWFVECLSRAGELEKARFYFEKMLSYANHLGLYSEQLGFQGQYLGNFPQSFTHLGLISAAFNLNRNLSNKRNKGINGSWMGLSQSYQNVIDEDLYFTDEKHL